MSLFPTIDFKKVQWKPTLQLHVIRSFSAGVVWGVVALLSGAGAVALGLPLMFPLVYLIGMPAYLFIAKIVAGMLGDDGFGPAVVGLMTLAFALGIVVGDPLVYLLHKKWPDFVPVERFALLNFVVVLFVYNPLTH